MPTGYTAELSEKAQSFEAFVWGCARAFGALVLMRDDPSDKPVPEKLEEQSFYVGQLAKTKSELAEWDGSGEVQRRAMYEAQKLADAQTAERYRERARATVARYRAMVERVRGWEPPSSEHTELRKFMLEQLATSIEHDGWEYSPTPLPEFSAWTEKHRKSLVDDLARYAGEVEKERDRNESRQRWVDQLRASVPQPSASP
jgi:hypothetical protein